MDSYWLIKIVLLAGLLVVAGFLMRPVRSQGHLALRRLGMMLMIVFAMFAVLFPGLLNRVAWQLGVDRGINLLVYVLVLAFFAQVATAYRRDSANEGRLTGLARAIALETARLPDAPPQAPADGSEVAPGATGRAPGTGATCGPPGTTDEGDTTALGSTHS